MKFVCQRDYPHWLYITRTGMEGEEFEKGKTSTVSSSACGLCCAVMMAHQLIPNCNFELSDAIDLSYATKSNQNRGTSYQTYAPALAEKLNLRYEVGHELADLHRCLQSGGKVVAHVHGAKDGREGTFSHGGHYILVIGYEADGRLAILDPALEPGRYDIPERKDKVQIKYGYLVVADDQTLYEDKSLKFPPYHLFWRK